MEANTGHWFEAESVLIITDWLIGSAIPKFVEPEHQIVFLAISSPLFERRKGIGSRYVSAQNS